MTDFSDSRKYTPSHLWLCLGADGLVTVGVTDHALETLGQINYVELPGYESQLEATEMCAQLASNFEVISICTPVSGEVVDTNQDAIETPGIINEDPFTAWLFKIRPKNLTEMDHLLDSTSYLSSCLYFAE